MKILLNLLLMCFFASVLQAQVSKTVVTDSAGTLESKLTSTELSTITDLTVKGKINELDFLTMRIKMPSLVSIDIGETDVVESERNGYFYPANEIPKYALSGNNKIKTIKLPSSATSIGPGAFMDCQGLKSFSNAVSVSTIGEEAFIYCKSLKSVEIPPLVTTIKQWAFYNCDSLTTVTIPASLTTIENECFNHTASFVVNPDNSHFSSLNGVLYNKNKTTLIQCSSSTSGNFAMSPTVVTVGPDAFRQCGKISGITFSSQLDSIKDYAFIGCAGLTTLTFPSTLTYIGSNAFYSCANLKTMELSTSLEFIGESAFERCALIDSIAIPSKVKRIGSWAFRYCNSLKTARFVAPSSLNEIGDLAFNGCGGLLSVNIPNTVIKLGGAAFQDCVNLKEAHLPSALTIIPYGLFLGCEKLASIDIPPTVTKIGRRAFMGCYILSSVILPTSVDTIEERAFAGCTALKSANIPASVKFIGTETYLNCKALLVIYVYLPTPVDLSSTENVFGLVSKSKCRLMVPTVSKSIYKSANQWKDFTLVGDIDVLLSGIKLDGVEIPAFHSTTFDYCYILPPGTSVPVIEAEALYQPNTAVKITQMSSLPGIATIEVTGLDKVTKQIHTVYLGYANELTNIVTMKSATKAGDQLWTFATGTQGQILIDYGDGNLKTSTLTNNSGFNPILNQLLATSPVDNPTIKIYGKSINNLFVTAFNKVTELDVSKNSGLQSLLCSDNFLTTLDVSKNSALTGLECNNNKLTSLKCSTENTALNEIYSTGNLLSACGLDSLFQSLPEQSAENKGMLYVGDNPGALTSKTEIAANKYWTIDVSGDGSGCDLSGIESSSLSDLVLYPNPGNGIYYLQTPSGLQVHSIEIFDINGRQRRCFDGFSSFGVPNRFDLRDLAKGNYLMKCHSNKGIVSKGFIKN